MGGGKVRPAKKTVPLAEQLHDDQFVTRQRNRARRNEEGEGAARMEPRAVRRIAEASRQHLMESDNDSDAAHSVDSDDEMPAPSAMPEVPGFDRPAEDFEGEVEELEYDDQESVMTEVQEFDADADELGNAYGITDEEAAAFDKFMPQSSVRSRNLADIIMAKINEKEARIAGEIPADEDDDAAAPSDGIDARVKRVYSAIGTVLKRYTSGKIPKAFKVLPHVQNWEQLLFVTRPHDWSPHATYAATRIFASHLNEKMAQRFYSAILLPIVHDAMAEEKKLHPALFMALRKALFKPVAFFKGFLLPMCYEGQATLREALAVGAVLQKMHLPPVPTAVTLVKISQLPYTPANGLILRVLVDKKMALPYQAVDALVKYFHRFVSSHSSEEKLPVLWHQTLLSFSQNYKMDLTPQQLELLRQVCTKHFHHMITPEIRREIAAAQGKASSMH